MNKSQGIAIGILFALVLWIASGYVSNESEPTPVMRGQPERETLMKVRVRTFDVSEVTSVVFVQGQLEPWRSVMLCCSSKKSFFPSPLPTIRL